MKTEKYVICREDFGVQPYQDMIRRSRTEFFNLEILDLPTSDFSLQFWQTCGPKIRELGFQHCRLHKRTLEHVTNYCRNLQSLHIQCKCGNDGEGILATTMLNRSFIRLRTRRKKLPSVKECRLFFELSGVSNALCEGIVERAFRVFPNLTSFEASSIRCWEVRSSIPSSVWFRSTALEELVINVPNNGKWLDILKNSPIRLVC